jgi:hypothetical protein
MGTVWCESHGVRWSRSRRDTGSWKYLPRSPRLRHGPYGRPDFSLLDLGASSRALGDRLADHRGHPDPTGLLDAAVRDGVATVSLDIADGDAGHRADLRDRHLGETTRTVARHDARPLRDAVVTVRPGQPVCEPVGAFADIRPILAADPAREPAGGQHAAD